MGALPEEVALYEGVDAALQRLEGSSHHHRGGEVGVGSSLLWAENPLPLALCTRDP